MKVLEHGRFYLDHINVICRNCDCRYEIKKEDIREYIKPNKIRFWAWDDTWTEKFKYFSRCPECGCDNHITDRDHETLTNNVLESDKT